MQFISNQNLWYWSSPDVKFWIVLKVISFSSVQNFGSIKITKGLKSNTSNQIHSRDKSIELLLNRLCNGTS